MEKLKENFKLSCITATCIHTGNVDEPGNLRQQPGKTKHGTAFRLGVKSEDSEVAS